MTPRESLFRPARVVNTYDIHAVTPVWRAYQQTRRRFGGNIPLPALRRLFMPFSDGSGIASTRSLLPNNSAVDVTSTTILDAIPEDP